VELHKAVASILVIPISGWRGTVIMYSRDSCHPVVCQYGDITD